MRVTVDERAPRRRSRWRVVWTVAAAVVVAGAVLLPHLDIAVGGVIPAAQALVPVGAAALIVLAVVSAAARTWIAAAILTVGAVLAALPTLTPLRATADCTVEATLTAVSFNAKFADADTAVLAERVRAARADVVVLVETDEAMIDALLEGEGLAAWFPHRTRTVTAGGVNGSVILSAHPLSDEADIPGSVFDQVTAVALLPGGTQVRVAALHPPPPVGQPLDWRAGLQAIDRWIEATPDAPLVVAGDFNASYAHPAFRHLSATLRSAAEAAGPIPWPTWPEERPVPAFTAIDHILARGAVPTSWDAFAVPGSDHRAVVGTFGLCAS
jgi:endonuclease/exonuclease/phosphatase (EEP) superfamily protein YafD